MTSQPHTQGAGQGPVDRVITGGLIVSGDGPPVVGDLALCGETIASIAPRIDAPGAERIDARGFLVLPGLVDPHVHLRLPMKGAVSSDDPQSGTRAALHGGVTTVIDFTCQHPGQALAESVGVRRADFDGHSHTDYALHATLTDFPADFARRLPDDLRAVRRQGIATMKVFTCYSRQGHAIGPDNLRLVLRAAHELGMLVLVHAEDDAMLNERTDRLLAAGETAPRDHARSRPAEVEAAAIAAVIKAARDVGAPVYFVHVSSRAGLETILAARAGDSGAQPVYLETCPQYLALTAEVYERADATQFLVAPPLRGEEDRAALLAALKRGDVDVIATDHCPFHSSLKLPQGRPFSEIPNGLPGVETRLPLVHTLAVRTGLIDLQRMVALLATGPARVHGLAPVKGSLQPGADADVVLFDSEEQWVLGPEALHSATDFSPYDGMRVRGRVQAVFLRGRCVLERGKATSAPSGRFLHRARETYD